MKIFKLIFKNALRHKLRSILTILGIAIAVISFGILRTVYTAWNAGVDAAGVDRLITRQAISFIFSLPYSYKDKIASVPGVSAVSWSNWFQGVYKDKDQFFSRLAVDAETILEVYPEFLLSEEERKNFIKEKNACIVGQGIAEQYGFKLGDIITLEGDIYPGRWEFVVRGIYKPKYDNTDGSQMLFHWDLVDERMRIESPGRAGQVGWYIVQIDDPSRSAEISEEIDKMFENSLAETKTETERAFTQNFISSSGVIIDSMNIISFVIVGIIMLVLGNTMIMAARERTREYAVFKTLGFSSFHLSGLIFGESMLISGLGGGLGILLTIPIIEGFSQVIPKGFFPVFQIEPITIIFAVSAVIIIGIASAVFPIHKALTTKIVDGFRFVG